MGVLGAVLLTLGLSSFSSAVFTPKKPATPGFALPADEPAPADGGNVAVTVPLPERLGKADMTRGQRSARDCVACHIFTETGEKKPGPPLHGILGRKVASVPGFGYSQGMLDYAKTHPEWTYEELDRFLQNPKGVVKNTNMQYGGVANAELRASLILYLRSLAANPAPLPQ